MSSRSIGVTNVSLRRRMMSWVIRSPSCSQIRMSRARSWPCSGKSRSIWSSRSAARRMLPPASSKRSKNSRSRGAMTWRDALAGATLATCYRRADAGLDVDACPLDAPRRDLAGLAEALADGVGARLVVVVDPALLELAPSVDERVGGAGSPSKGMPTLPGFTSSRRLGALAPELQVGVAEHEPAHVPGAASSSSSSSAGSGRKLSTSEHRRGVAEQGVALAPTTPESAASSATRVAQQLRGSVRSLR